MARTYEFRGGILGQPPRHGQSLPTRHAPREQVCLLYNRSFRANQEGSGNDGVTFRLGLIKLVRRRAENVGRFQVRASRSNQVSRRGSAHGFRANEQSRSLRPLPEVEIVRSLESAEVKALALPSPGQAVPGLPGRTGCGNVRRPAQSSPRMFPPCGRPRARLRLP